MSEKRQVEVLLDVEKPDQIYIDSDGGRTSMRDILDGVAGTPGEGLPVTEGNFQPAWRLQSAANEGLAQPVIADGKLEGYFYEHGGMVDIVIFLEIGPHTDNGTPSGRGTSRYYFLLPEGLPQPAHQISGACRAWNGGAGLKEWAGAAFFSRQYPGRIQLNMENEVVGVSHPKTWDALDYMVIQLRYRAA